MSGVRQEGLYLCVQEMHQQGHAIAEICDILDLNRSSYYKWTHRTKSSREIENEALLHDIGMIYAEHNGTYGYRRIADEYNETHEKKYNLKRFYRLVHIVGLLAIIRRKRPAYQRSKPEVTAENILNREFTADKVNEKWCTDVTEMKFGSDGEKAYLSAILDLKSRDIVSFAIGKSNNNQLVFETFDLAIQKYPDAHPLFHSDRGFQYTSKLFKTKLDKQKMVSLSKKSFATFLTALQPPSILHYAKCCYAQKACKYKLFCGRLLYCEAGFAPSCTPATLLSMA